jgi:hypothetical protein
MYITRVEIENIHSIKHLVWEIDSANAPGWHVILGDNGSGQQMIWSEAVFHCDEIRIRLYGARCNGRHQFIGN